MHHTRLTMPVGSTLLHPVNLGVLLALFTACNRQPEHVPQPPTPHGAAPPLATEPPPTELSALPPGHPPITTAAVSSPANVPIPTASDAPPTESVTNVKLTDQKLTLDGLTFRIPDGWILEPAKASSAISQMSPKAIFRLPRDASDPSDGEIRITHFPRMKGAEMNAMNLQRWLSQVSQADGRPSTDVAVTRKFTVGPVTLTLLDVTGTYAAGASMRGAAGAPKDNQRFIGVIIDHAKGPHFVKAVGPKPTMDHWADSIEAFLRTGTVH